MKVQTVSVDMNDGIAIVRIDNPPVNATSTAVRAGLMDAVAQVVRLDARAAVLICSGKTFIAGGDMSEFDAPPVGPHLPDVVQTIEDSSVPFVAAMHGSVLGGGLEIALSCAGRIALENTKFGMPEVNVGLIPGAGGTQRLPRLVGMKLAIEMCSNGIPLKANKFKEAGGLDVIVTENLEQEAILFANSIQKPTSKVSMRSITKLSKAELDAHRMKIEASAKGLKAPLLNFDAVLWSSEPFLISQPKERALHLELRQSAESRALRHAFFAERSVSKPAIIKGIAPKAIKKTVVVGGGLMGSGIATSMLNADLLVTIIERDDHACQAAIERVTQNLDAAEKRGLISNNQKTTRLSYLNSTSNYEDANGHDLAVEAVFEDVGVKQSVFNELAQHMSGDAILATNTSYLDPQLIFDRIPNPERCVGLHFFSPAHIMKLLEVVQLPQTSAETLSTAFALAKALRKTAVLSGICDGFIGNRMLAAYRRASEYMLADGALPHEIDQAMRDFGMAMGPFEAQDMSGLQIAEANRRRQDKTRSPDERYVEISDRLCAMGRLGQRSGKGWYLYEDGKRKPQIDADITALIEAYTKELGIARKHHTTEDIQNLLIAALANEGARIVEEGIAESDAAVDIVKLHGYGFPKWRGGPMNTASEFGKAKIRSALTVLETASPSSWKRAARYT